MTSGLPGPPSHVDLPVVRKVMIYVLDDRRRVLTFTQRSAPSAGMQIPAGTIEPGETPAAAALRELQEETGVAAMVEPIHFAESMEDMRAFRDELHLRSWFLVSAEGFPSSSWTHVEHRADDGDIVGDFAWTDVRTAVSDLVAGQAAQLVLARRLADAWLPR